jgi:hypothetical protein
MAKEKKNCISCLAPKQHSYDENEPAFSKFYFKTKPLYAEDTTMFRPNKA